MRVMVRVKATDDSERGFKPSPWTTGMMQAMGRFNDELQVAFSLATHSTPHRALASACKIFCRKETKECSVM